MLVTHRCPWAPTRALDVQLALDRQAPRSLTRRTRVRVLMGTAEVMARVLPRAEVEPGGSGLARLRLETPLVARAGDRFVLRSFSPVTTIGGGGCSILCHQGAGSGPRSWRRIVPLNDSEPSSSAAPRGVERFLLPILLGIPEQEANEIAGQEPDVRLVGSLWIRHSAMRIAAAGSRSSASITGNIPASRACRYKLCGTACERRKPWWMQRWTTRCALADPADRGTGGSGRVRSPSGRRR